MKTLLVALLLIAGYAFAQTDTIPLVRAYDINYIPDSLASTWPASPLAGKTVHVRGQVMLRTMVDATTDRRPILTYTKAQSSYIQTDDSLWSGLNVYQLDSSIHGTAFDLIDTASTYEFTGVVTTYGQGTELILTVSPTPIPVSLVSQQEKRQSPIVLTLDSFYNAGTFNNDMRKYYGMYVELKHDDQHPLITSALITGTSSTAGGFKVNDNNGHRIQMYAQSNYFKTATTYPRLRTDGYTPPTNGSYIDYIKGVLNAYNSPTDGWIWEIVPVYPEDLGPVLVSPPAISNCSRDLGVVAPNTSVNVRATAVGMTGGIVQSVKLFTRINGVEDSIAMTAGSGADLTTYSCTIAGVPGDSSYVEYYVKATDDRGLSSTSPQGIATSRFSYLVLNRPLKISDVRYSPLGSGYSSYNNYKVQVTGVVISDTTDITGNHGTNPSRVYIQDGNTPWSGIGLGTNGPLVASVGALNRGDNVTVEGTVVIGAYGTRIDSMSLITVNSTKNDMPAPHIMKTSDVGTSTLGALTAEPWNGCLVTYKKVTIDQRNADTSATGTDFGESYCQDTALGTHTRLIWSDGHTSFNVGAAAIKVSKGDTFDSITGVLGYTHAAYKLCPRKDEDIFGYNTGVTENAQVIPTHYNLNQNYPNPFNPSTIISYDLPKTGMVTVRIFNILGQAVKTLVNQVQTAGSHQVSFNASSLTSGVYFYSLSANDFTSVKKMMLLK